MFVLASLALVGVACSKSDDNGGGNSGENNQVTPTQFLQYTLLKKEEMTKTTPKLRIL